MDIDRMMIVALAQIAVLIWIAFWLHHCLTIIIIELKFLRTELEQERKKHRDDMSMIRHLLGRIDRSCGSGEL